MTDYGVRIFPHHAKMLADSAISVEVARERGYLSVDQRKQLGQLKFSSVQQCVPGLLIPVYDETGAVALHQFRPDEPRVTKSGKPIKYETTPKARMAVDVPKRVREHLGNPARPLWLTEGIRKADAAVSAGLDCLGLLGVWNWRGRNTDDGLTALAFWESVALNDRRVYLCFDSDVMLKESVHAALVRLGAFLARRGGKIAYVYLPSHDGDKVGLDDYLAADGVIPDLVSAAQSKPLEPPRKESGPKPEVESPSSAPPPDPNRLTGVALLDAVQTFAARFVAWPSGAAAAAHALWCVHAHTLDAAESTPRLALLSPEPESGKTRALEVTDLLVPAPMHAVNATPAALFRSISDLEKRPTILYDEIDTVFGPKAKENEEIRGLLNAGHRRSGVAYRCVGEGTKQKVAEFPAYCAVALAGLGDLPDTIMGRSIIVKMRRRSPNERVEAFRQRVVEPQGHTLRDWLAAWADEIRGELTGADPEMPDGIVDRSADVWEPLLAIADVAGGHWPQTARDAALELAKMARGTDSGSLGIRLLADLRSVFGDAGALTTETILLKLHAIDDAPWGELGKQRKPLDARGLARRLKPYGASPHNVRVGEIQGKGYERGDLLDAWDRYLPPSAESPSQPSHRPKGDHSRCSEAGTDRTGTDAPSWPGTDTAVPGIGETADQTPSDQGLGRWDGWDASTAEGGKSTRYDCGCEPPCEPGECLLWAAQRDGYDD